MAEALWKIRINGLGPLIVTIDSSGRNIFTEKKREIARRKEEQIDAISKKLATILK